MRLMSSSHFLLLLASWPRTYRHEPSLDRTCGSTRSVLHDLDRLKRLMDVGVARVVPMFPLEKSDKVLPIIDRWTKLMQQASG
jgi:hypothetical protein